MSEPIAYFITFRTYGTWLHGDVRGSFERAHKRSEHGPAAVSPGLQAWERQRLKHSVMVLDDAQRAVVHRALADLCAERGWDLHALNVRTNHVHVVVAAPETIEAVMGTMKGRATRELRAAGLVMLDRPCWSRHGSTRRVWDRIQLEVVRAYVRDAQ